MNGSKWNADDIRNSIAIVGCRQSDEQFQQPSLRERWAKSGWDKNSISPMDGAQLTFFVQCQAFHSRTPDVTEASSTTKVVMWSRIWIIKANVYGLSYVSPKIVFRVLTMPTMQCFLCRGLNKFSILYARLSLTGRFITAFKPPTSGSSFSVSSAHSHTF